MRWRGRRRARGDDVKSARGETEWTVALRRQGRAIRTETRTAGRDLV